MPPVTYIPSPPPGQRHIRYDPYLRFHLRSFAYTPAWRVQTIVGLHKRYVCAGCFEKRGDGPLTDNDVWTAGCPGGAVVPSYAMCDDCGGPCWPKETLKVG